MLRLALKSSELRAIFVLNSAGLNYVRSALMCLDLRQRAGRIKPDDLG